MAGVVIVGDCDILGALPTGSIGFGETEVQDFDRPVGAHLDVRGFQIAMNDPLFVRRFEGFRNLLRNRQRFVDGDRSTRDMLRTDPRPRPAP